MISNQYLYTSDLVECNLFTHLNKGSNYYNIDEEFKYYLKISQIGTIVLKFKASNKDTERVKDDKRIKYISISSDEQALDILFLSFKKDEEEEMYNEKSIKKYIIDSGFNIHGCDIKYINITNLFNKIIFHQDANIDGLDYKVNHLIVRPDIRLNITSPNGYEYHSAINIVKKLYSTDQIKPLVNELFDEIKLLSISCKKIEEIEKFMFNYGFYTRVTKINKYDLKAFSTFYNGFNKENIERHLEDNIKRDSLNRLSTIVQKVTKSINKGQIENINLTIKGIKFYYNKHNPSGDIVFEIPTLRYYSFVSKEVEFLYAYLTSLDEFDSLIYKFERIYLSSL